MCSLGLQVFGKVVGKLLRQSSGSFDVALPSPSPPSCSGARPDPFRESPGSQCQDGTLCLPPTSLPVDVPVPVMQERCIHQEDVKNVEVPVPMTHESMKHELMVVDHQRHHHVEVDHKSEPVTFDEKIQLKSRTSRDPRLASTSPLPRSMILSMPYPPRS